MTTITAAFDCQSKPNHMTMIGAMPTIGMALTRLPSGSSPRCRKGERSIATAQESGAAADDVAGDDRPEEGLLEIRRQRRRCWRQRMPDHAGRRQQDARHAEARP